MKQWIIFVSAYLIGLIQSDVANCNGNHEYYCYQKGLYYFKLYMFDWQNLNIRKLQKIFVKGRGNSTKLASRN